MVFNVYFVSILVYIDEEGSEARDISHWPSHIGRPTLAVPHLGNHIGILILAISHQAFHIRTFASDIAILAVSQKVVFGDGKRKVHLLLSGLLLCEYSTKSDGQNQRVFP